MFPEIQMVSVHYCTFPALPLCPLGRICFCLTLPGFRNPITLGLCVIPILLVVLAGLCGREEAQHSLWLGCLSYKTPVPLIKHDQLSFQEQSSTGRGHLVSVPECWQVSWLCWARSSSHVLPGVLRMTREMRPWPRCLLWRGAGTGTGTGTAGTHR